MTGSTNIQVITNENSDLGNKDLALVSSLADYPDGELQQAEVNVITIFHNSLLGIQGGDLQNRYHLNKVLYDALKTNINASAINRFLVLTDLNNYYTQAQVTALINSKVSIIQLTTETNARIAGDNNLNNQLTIGLDLKVDKAGYIAFTTEDKAKLDSLNEGEPEPIFEVIYDINGLLII